MVRTPSINRGRGRCVQVHRKEILDRGITLAGTSNPKRATSLCHYQHLHQTPEVINFQHMIDLECEEETNIPPLESSDNEDNRV